jgi:hypothetical protein
MSNRNNEKLPTHTGEGFKGNDANGPAKTTAPATGNDGKQAAPKK